MKLYSDSYLLKNIKITGNNEKLVSLDWLKRTRIGNKNVLKSKRNNLYVRKTVLKMLKRAEKLLPKDYGFIIFDGYREEKLQRKYFLRYINKLKKKFPDFSDERLKKEAAKYVANPDSFCPHVTGGAIDVSLSKNNRQIKMGGFNLFKEKNIPKYVKKNREMLKKIMEKSGFVNYPLEWWHWSYGDRYWAAVKKRNAIYDKIG